MGQISTCLFVGQLFGPLVVSFLYGPLVIPIAIKRSLIMDVVFYCPTLCSVMIYDLLVDFLYDAMSCHVTSCHIKSCHIMSYHVMHTHHITSRHIT